MRTGRRSFCTANAGRFRSPELIERVVNESLQPFFLTSIHQKNMNNTNTVEKLVNMFDVKAAIFDLDGTLIDNNAFHLKTWKKYLENLGIDISEEAYRKISMAEPTRMRLNTSITERWPMRKPWFMPWRKKLWKPEIYRPLKPVDGLFDLLDSLNRLNIPMAIATSGIQVNVDFMFEHIFPSGRILKRSWIHHI